MKPSYLALCYFQHYVRANPTSVLRDPGDLLTDAILALQDRMVSDEIRQWVLDVYQTLDQPSAQDRLTARSFDDAETRFLDVLVRGQSWDGALLMNNLGKVGTDLGFKVPFLF
jgi:hypothetical protein